MLLANFDRKEHLQHRAVSLRQHGFLVILCYYSSILSEVAFVIFCLKNKMNDKINDGLIKFRIGK